MTALTVYGNPRKNIKRIEYMIFYIIGQVAPKIINLEQRHKGLAEISASLLFFIVSDKRQIRTNRLLPKGSDYFDLVEIRGFEPLTYTLRTYRATNCAISPKL